MAKYKKRADGRKEGTIKIDGKRYHVYGYTDAEINRQKEALLAAAHDGSLYIDKVTTFEEWALRWQGIRPNLETKTVEMYVPCKSAISIQAYFFLLAMVFFGPFLVLALVLDRCPRTGRPFL